MENCFGEFYYVEVDVGNVGLDVEMEDDDLKKWKVKKLKWDDDIDIKDFFFEFEEEGLEVVLFLGDEVDGGVLLFGIGDDEDDVGEFLKKKKVGKVECEKVVREVKCVVWKECM